MKKHILVLLALLIALSGTTCAVAATNPGIIHSGEVFIIYNGDTLTVLDDDNDYLTVDLLIEAGGSLVIESGGNLTLSGGLIANEGSIDSSGTINGYGYGTIRNNGTFNNFNTVLDISIENYGTINNWDNIMGVYCSNFGTIHNEGGIDLAIGTIHNHGIFFNSGGIFLESGITNSGNFSNSGYIFMLLGSINNSGTFYNSGSIDNARGSTITNSGTIHNSGLIYLYMDDHIRNLGLIDNSGIISSSLGKIENEGIINNSGTISDYEASNYEVSFIYNNGTINNCTTGIIAGPINGNPVKTVTCPGENVPVTSIAVTGQGAATTVENGKTLQITATVTPATATNKDVTWSVTSGTGTATISATGLMTGTKAGTVTVKATAKDGSGVQGSLLITITAVPVTVIPVTGIALSEATTTVETGKTLQMTATVYPENATNKNVLWSVESITGDAVISETGLLTGKAAGNVTVRVTSVANSNVKDALNITVTAAKTVSSKSGGGGGGGGGGSGSSGEKTQNIALKDVSSIFVAKGSVRFDFKNPDNDIQYIEYTSLKNSGTITATVEVLKERSTFAASSPKGVIYRHINIWLGKTGYVTETNLESPVIGFRVDKSWIEDKGIDPASVVLNRYSGDKWNVLSTTQTKSDDKYYYYQAETPGFSPFAITGVSLDEAAVHSTNGDEMNEHVSFVDLNGTEAQAENNLPGLPFIVTLLIVSIACFLKRKQ